ncbi:MAG: 16S rRNA (cytosine(967)-C(5))-methyltransferase RsmB [Candidatus Sericytochromatia bacterium]|nr:16S rRNA (cytosine(967)-C(5))-methyltransferase RsmB [Candidatus Sericytochromatia bacterium]
MADAKGRPRSHKTPPAPVEARGFALQRLVEIEAGGSYANLALKGLSDLPAQERGLATELVGGVTRRRGTLDWYLSRLLKGSLAGLTPVIRNVLRLGAYQLLFLTRVPASAAVDEAVKLAHRHGHEGVARLVNAVLRNLVRQRAGLDAALPDPGLDPIGALEVRYALPRWLAARWHAEHGPEAEALGAWSVRPAQLALRVNPLRTTRESMLAALAAHGVPAVPSEVAPEGIRLQAPADPAQLPGWDDGWFYVQDEAAMLVAHVVGPVPGECVLDLGAAPGGKTTHLAALMAGRGELWAVDRSAARLKLLEANQARLGLTGIRTHVGDATDLTALPLADRILLDAPCSGLGVLPRKPDLRWRQTPEAIADLAPLQGRMLDAAASRLRPGGRLVYSTCTMGREENQAVIQAFLSRHPEFTPDDFRACLPEAWRADTELGGAMLQLRPDRHGVDGFFIAALRRGMMNAEEDA